MSRALLGRGGRTSIPIEMQMRPRLPRPLRWLVVLTVLALLAAAGYGAWRLELARRTVLHELGQSVGERRAAERELLRMGAEREQLLLERDQLAARMTELEAGLRAVAEERDRLAAAAGVAESQATIERAASDRLASELRAIEAENARLKADLHYLESLLPADGSRGVVSIRGLQFVPDTVPQTWRYRALLMQGGRAERSFDGSLQLVVTGMQNSESVTLVWPSKTDPQSRQSMAVRFTRSLRVEGAIELPEGFEVESVQLRVMENGAVRAEQRVAI
ncbi:MAG: hypothetical protein JSW68_12415 [Burkholderiales bacterium]|nr:MAG: hypothetical protein JSW68_12415 [Burkholderiales bacterium]